MLSISTSAISPKTAPKSDRQRHDRPVSQQRQVLVEDGHRGAHSADEVGHDAGHEAGKQHRVLDASEVEDLDAEERARHRRAEHRGEPGADAADHETAPVLVVEPEHVGKEAGDRGADLRARALLADRAAEGEREHRGQQLDWGDEPVDLARPLVDRGDDGLGAVPLRRRREGADEPHAEQAAPAAAGSTGGSPRRRHARRAARRRRGTRGRPGCPSRRTRRRRHRAAPTSGW